MHETKYKNIHIYNYYKIKWKGHFKSLHEVLINTDSSQSKKNLSTLTNKHHVSISLNTVKINSLVPETWFGIFLMLNIK